MSALQITGLHDRGLNSTHYVMKTFASLSFTTRLYRLHRLELVLILFVILLFGWSRQASGQPLNAPLAQYWRPDGPVHTILVTNGVAYLGGAFSYLGPDSGGAGVIDLATTEAKRGFPKIVGTVFAAVPDGAGGWFVGGAFTNIGSVIRTNLAHVLADNTVDPNWTPHLNGICSSLVSADGRLYVGGAFTRVASTTRNRMAAVNQLTGEVTTWNPNASSTVNVLALDAAGTTLYVGGNFTTIGGSNRTRIAALNLATGFATSWNPGANQIVTTIAPVGNTIYVGGNFTTIGSLPRNRIAALDATVATGLATDWNPNIVGGVSNLVIGASVAYVGGSFTNVGGALRRCLAAIDLVTGLPTDWNPNPDTNVNTLLLIGETLYAGGAFTNIGGADRRLMAALDLTNGTALPTVTAGSALGLGVRPAVQVMCLANNQMLVGGSFASIGGVVRSRIAALSNATGEPTAWNPDANGTVSALAFAGNTLYVGGSFTNIGGQLRNRLAALSDATGEATTWHPDVRGRAGVAVLALALSAPRLYVGGINTTEVGSVPRTNLFSVALIDGQPTTWNPATFRSATLGSVNTLGIDGSSIVVGGDFVSINGQTRSNLAALAISGTGTVESWSPNPNNIITALVVSSNTVYAGGTFTSIGSLLRNRLAAVDRTTGLGIGPWSQDVSGTGARINALAQAPGVLYAGGQFTVIGGAFRTNTGVVRLDNGQAASWQPNCGAAVRAISAGEGAVFLGGDFLSVGGKPHSYFAVFANATEIIPTSVAVTTGQFGFQIRSGEASQIIVQRSGNLGNLASWTPISTNPATGTLIPFSDPEPVGLDPRYYRLAVPVP